MKSNVISFIFGLAAGVVVTYCATSMYYENIIDEEIESVKETYKNREVVPLKPNEAEAEGKPDLAEYVKMMEKNNYTAYSGTEVKDKEKEEEVKEMPEPYIITEDQFNDENPDYEKLSFTYYANGVLTDDTDNIVEDEVSVVGYATDEFDNEDTSVVYVRNDLLCADYEICRDLEDYTK